MVVGYEQLTKIQFVLSPFILLHLNESRGNFRDVEGLSDREKLKSYSRTILTDLLWHAFRYQQSSKTFNDHCVELAT